MAQKQLRTVRANGTALGFVKATMPDKSEYSAFSPCRQPDIDVVGILVARSGVAPATIRAQFDAWQIGGGW